MFGRRVFDGLANVFGKCDFVDDIDYDPSKSIMLRQINFNQ